MVRPSSPSEKNALPQPVFSNPPVAEGINYSTESQLKSFFVNLGIVAAALIVILTAVTAAAHYLTPLIPFRWERRLAIDSLLDATLDADGTAKREALRRLARTLSAHMALPEDMEVTVFYSSAPIVNAFATIGGNIMVFQGLLDLVESEDELAMVVAHEIAHVKHRDVIKGLAQGVGVMALFAGVGDPGAHVTKMTELGMAGYSRSQEAAADREAVRTLGKVYGHAGGAEVFFTSLAAKIEKRSPEDDQKGVVSSLTASHPDTLYHLEMAHREAALAGIPERGELTPLPDALR